MELIFKRKKREPIDISFVTKERVKLQREQFPTIEPEPERSLFKGAMAKTERIGASIGAGIAGSLGGFSEMLEWVGVEKAKPFSEKMDIWQKELTPKDQTFIEKAYGGAGSMSLYYVPGLGVAKGTGMIAKVSPKIAKFFGGSTMAALEGGSEAGSVWKDNLDMGKSEAEADDRAQKTFWSNAVLGSITNKVGIFGDSKKILKRMLLSSSMEGVQEYGQAVISNVATDKQWDLGAMEAGKIGFLLGGIFGSVDITTDTKGVVKENIQKEIKVSPEKATEFTEVIQTLQKEERKPTIFRDIKEGTSKNILNLLHTEPTTKIQDIKPAERMQKIMRGEIKVEPVKKEVTKPEKKVIEKPIEDLISHEGAPDKAKVLMNVEMIETGKDIEPILISKEGKKFGIVDGQHRYEAYKQLGYKTVPTVEEIKPTKVTKPKYEVSKYAKGVEAKAIANKITEKFEGLPEHEVRNMIKQAQKANVIVKEDLERAKRIVFENETPPAGTNATAFANALEEKATREGDVEMLRRIGTSQVMADVLTQAGQEIRTAGERYKDSPVVAIQDVIAAREDAFKGDVKAKKKEVATQIKKEIKKATPTKESWSSFIQSIKC